MTDSYAKMSQVADDLTGSSDTQTQSSSEMTQAAGTLKGLPAEVASAIESGLARVKIYIDGQTAGRVLSPYVSGSMGSALASFTK